MIVRHAVTPYPIYIHGEDAAPFTNPSDTVYSLKRPLNVSAKA